MNNRELLPLLILLVLVAGCVQQPVSDDTEKPVTGEASEPLDNETSPVPAQGTNATTENVEGDQSKEELTFEEMVWNQRIDAAMAPTDCPAVPEPEYGEGYYTGTLIDSHFHMPALQAIPIGEEPDFPPGDQMPRLGINVQMSDIVCTLEHEGTDKVFAFFPVYQEIPLQMLDVASRTMQQYPEHIVPFISPPDDVLSTVEADELDGMLSLYPGLFQGYGEIGLHGSEPGTQDDLPPDSPIFLEIYPVVRKHKLAVYFHPGEEQEDNFERILEENPDINFIVHGEQIEAPDEIGALMSTYPNIYFTVNDLYGDLYLLHPGESTETFLAALEDYEPLLEKDLATWKGLIEAHPDQFLWGTDRGGIAVWTFDREVGQKLTDYARAFIGRLDPAVQEKFAYKNAERVM